MDWKMLVGKRIRLYFYDRERVVVRIGLVEEANNLYLFLKAQDNKKEMIPHSSIVRAEEAGE